MTLILSARRCCDFHFKGTLAAAGLRGQQEAETHTHTEPCGVGGGAVCGLEWGILDPYRGRIDRLS